LSETTNAEDRARIEAQMLLINRAQTAEISQFNANMAGSQNMVEGLWDQVNAIMGAIGGGTDLTDEEIAMQGMLAGVLNQLQSPANTRAQAYANPPQMAYPSSSGGGTTTNSQTVNMPIYTNNSPAALQQSWQVLQASMP